MDINRLKMLRKSKRISQKDLAAILGFSQQRYNFYETGRNEPDHETLIKLSEFFNVSADYLLGTSNDSIPPTEKRIPPSDKSKSGIRERIDAIIAELPDEAMPHVLKIVRAYIPDDEESQ